MTSTIELLPDNMEANYTSHPADLVKGGVRYLHLHLTRILMNSSGN